MTPSAETNNIIIFTASKKDAVSQWDFGNSTNGEGVSSKGAYPYKGTYTVTHTIFTQGGNISNSKEVIIENDDLTLLSSPLTSLIGLCRTSSCLRVFNFDCSIGNPLLCK